MATIAKERIEPYVSNCDITGNMAPSVAPNPFAERFPCTSIQLLALNLTSLLVGTYIISLQGLFNAYARPLSATQVIKNMLKLGKPHERKTKNPIMHGYRTKHTVRPNLRIKKLVPTNAKTNESELMQSP